MSTYLAIAYYYFTPILDLQEDLEAHRNFLNSRDIRGRIYLSQEGVNGQVSGEYRDALGYIDWLRKKYEKIVCKVQPCQEHAFYKLTIKIRKQLVAFDHPVDLSKRGNAVSPSTWKKMLEEKDKETVVIDVRNNYESKVGHFKGAILPPCASFREFPSWTSELEKQIPKEAKVMIYCTGGIRCEYYSTYLQEKGYTNVYQLEGGIIQYGFEEGGEHFQGKLFVFDDRLVVPLQEGDVEAISSCHHCGLPSDVYYNCANMDCNELFTCCHACSQVKVGCCSSSCMAASRLRPFDSSPRPKPFRKQAKKI